MRTWARTHRYGTGSIPQFIRLAERVSGQRLDRFFDVWLYTAAKPAPTRANGFPRDVATRAPAARRAEVPSLTKIRAVKEFLLDSGHAG
jgi:hypothetical protein